MDKQKKKTVGSETGSRGFFLLYGAGGEYHTAL